MFRIVLPVLASCAAAFALAPVAAHANDPFAGRKVYEQRCIGCHGPQGMAMMPGVPSFARGERLNYPDRMLLASLKNGKNMCPAWGKIVPDGQLLDVLAYIRTLRR
jgi:cytochrome c6